MLGDIRKNVKHPFIQGLLAIIIIVFVLFFGWSMRGARDSGDGQPYVTLVNGEPITARELNSAYSNLVELYSRITGQKLNQEQARKMGIEKRALQQLIDQKVMLQEAKRRGYKVSDEELASAIQRQSTFQENGAFSRDRYMQLIANAGLTAEQFEEIKREELLMGKIEEAAKSGVTISEEDIAAEYRDRKTTVAADYAVFDPEKFAKQVLPTTEKLKEFHTAEGEKFRVEERRRAKYLLFPAENYMAQVQISDEEAKREYERAPAKYNQAEKVRARHILIRAERDGDSAKDAKALAKIRSLRDLIAKGQDFAAVARANSEDPGTKENGGDLGFFARNTMVPEFDRAAFALKAGEVSEPVRTQFGYHLIKIEQKAEAKQASFAEAKGDVVNFLKRDKALELSYKDADNSLMDLEQKKTDWDALAKKFPGKTTGLLTAKERDANVPPVRGFMEALFEMDAKRVGQVIETPAGAMIVSVAEARPAEIPPFEMIRTEVESKYKVVEAKKLAKEAGARFAADAAAKGWAGALTGRGLETGVTETFSKKNGSVPPLGANEDAVKAIFEKPETGRVVAQPQEFEGKYYVFRISAAAQPDMTSLALDREKIRADILPAKQGQATESLIKTLRDSAKLEGKTPETIDQP